MTSQNGLRKVKIETAVGNVTPGLCSTFRLNILRSACVISDLMARKVLSHIYNGKIFIFVDNNL